MKYWSSMVNCYKKEKNGRTEFRPQKCRKNTQIKQNALVKNIPTHSRKICGINANSTK